MESSDADGSANGSYSGEAYVTSVSPAGSPSSIYIYIFFSSQGNTDYPNTIYTVFICEKHRLPWYTFFSTQRKEIKRIYKNKISIIFIYMFKLYTYN